MYPKIRIKMENKMLVKLRNLALFPPRIGTHLIILTFVGTFLEIAHYQSPYPNFPTPLP